jgi:hypothetical protein
VLEAFPLHTMINSLPTIKAGHIARAQLLRLASAVPARYGSATTLLSGRAQPAVVSESAKARPCVGLSYIRARPRSNK